MDVHLSCVPGGAVSRVCRKDRIEEQQHRYRMEEFD
jgi:hypothetical protein